MARGKRNRKSKSKIDRREQERSAASLKSTRPRSDRHKLIALLMASLVAGLLLVVNGDRVTHAGKELRLGESHHGFPVVYLKRYLEKEPVIFIHGRTYSWPLPAVDGEIREWSFANLAIDMVIVIAAVIATYWLISAIVYGYDRWKYQRQA